MTIFPGGVARALAERDSYRRVEVPASKRDAPMTWGHMEAVFSGQLGQYSGLISNHQAYRDSPWIQPSIHAFASACAARPFRLFRDVGKKRAQLDTHWLLDLMERPNPWAKVSSYALKYQTFSLFDLDGEVFWHKGWKADANGTKPKGIRKTPPEFITIFRKHEVQPAMDGTEFLGWDISINGVKYFADREDVVHFTFYDPTEYHASFNPFTMEVQVPNRGRSPLESKRLAISTDVAMARYNRDFFGRGLAPHFAFIAPKGVDMTTEEGDRFLDKLTAQIGGKNARAMMLEGEWKIEQLKASQRDAEFEKGRKTSKEEQLAGLAPPIVMGESDATYANAQQQMLMWYEVVIDPALTHVCATIDANLLVAEPDIWSELGTDDVEALQFAKRERLKSAIELRGSGVPMDVAARTVGLDMESYEGSDIAFGKYTDIPITAIMEGFSKAEIPTVEPVTAPKAPNEIGQPPSDTPPPQDQGRMIRVVSDVVDDESVRVTYEETVATIDLSSVIRADDASLRSIARRFHLRAMDLGVQQIAELLETKTPVTLDNARVKRLLESRAAMVAAVNATTECQVNDAIAAGVAENEDADTIASRVKDVYNTRKKDSDFIARQESISALNGFRFIQIQESGAERCEWLRGRECELHSVGDEVVVETGVVFANGCRFPHDPEGPRGESFRVMDDGRRVVCNCTVAPVLAAGSLLRSADVRATYWRANVQDALRSVEKQFASALGRQYNEQRGRVLAELAIRLAKPAVNPQAAISDLADKAITKASGNLDSMATKIKSIVAGASSLEDVPDLLRKAFKDIDASELETVIRRTVFVSRMHGRETVKR